MTGIDTVNYRDFRDFLASIEPGTSRSAITNACIRCLAILFRRIGDDKLTLFCAKCGRQRGVCRCLSRAWCSEPFDPTRVRRGPYLDEGPFWNITCQSLLALSDEDVAGLPERSAARLKLYREYLRKQMAQDS